METKNIRNAVRAVIFDDYNNIAILDVKNGTYHKIPGGGIKESEQQLEALKREVKEEAGCEIKIIDELGELQFVDPDGSGTIHHSVYFLAKKTKDHGRQYFTDAELKNEFKLLWVEIDDAIELFKNVKTKERFELEMNKRDLNFVKMAKLKLI